MADTFVTLADMVKLNDQNLAPFEANALLRSAKVVRRLAAIGSSNGTEHKFLVQTGEPTVGFRDVNDGRENSAGADTLTTITLKILDASNVIDKALAMKYSKGIDAAVERFTQRHLRAAFYQLEKQLFYGTGNDADGCAGLADNADLNALADSQVVNAGGSAAAATHSVYLLRADPEGVAVVMDNDGNFDVGETVEQRVSGTTGTYTGLYTSVIAWAGFQIACKYDAVRIANLDATHGLTDDLISDALALFKADSPANLIAVNRTALKDLQQSRTATNATGAPAPIPQESFGVPIVSTDALGTTDAVTT